MSNLESEGLVPYRVEFEGLIDPSEIPPMIRILSEFATLQSITVQFLDAEGDALGVRDILRQKDSPEFDRGPSVSRDEFIATVTKEEVSPIAAGRAWGRLARSYNDVVEGREQIYIAEFTDIAGPGKEDVHFGGRLYVDSLRERVQRVEAVIGQHHSESAISRACGGDVGPVTFGIWKTFLKNWQPATSEGQ